MTTVVEHAGGSVDDVPVSDTAMRERVARVIGTWVRTGSLDKAADELLAVVRPGERYDDLCVCGHIRNTHGPGCDRCYDEMSGSAECPTFRPVTEPGDPAVTTPTTG